MVIFKLIVLNLLFAKLQTYLGFQNSNLKINKFFLLMKMMKF